MMNLDEQVSCMDESPDIDHSVAAVGQQKDSDLGEVAEEFHSGRD